MDSSSTATDTSASPHFHSATLSSHTWRIVYFGEMSTPNDRPVWFLLTRHWLSVVGCALIATALLSLLFALPLRIRGDVDNPYIGIVVFFVLPLILFVGLAVVPVGIFIGKRRIREGLDKGPLDRKSALRRIAWFFAITGAVNVLIGTQVTYRAVKHMDTPNFCGVSCHSMNPQFAAYQNSPHSRVECVECHVAPGAAGWISSKTNGLRQLVETVLKTAPKPIPSALASNRLVPARETCENCHWPQMFGGVRLRVFSRYADDESNTRSDTVLLLFVGGNKISGIHGAHTSPDIHIRYAAADPARQTIPWVEYRNDRTKTERTFVTADGPPRSADDLPKFEMGCVDCHNRPTHSFDLPDRAVDKALASGDISISLPFIRKVSVELLKAAYSTRDEATSKLPAALAEYYRQNHPDVYAQRSDDIRHAAQAVLAIYERNVFPDLKVGWGTYPNNLGHVDFPGCFRCHDGSHTAGDGKTIDQQCDTCHQVLASDEASPEILKTLGIAERISNIQKK